MNLHINKDEFTFLISAKQFGTFTIGSRLYGLNDEQSDRDYLIVLYPFIQDSFNSHHQFQYKDEENNVDYNFVDVHTFISNLVKGDSLINYELLYSPEFKQSKLGWVLCDYLQDFRTYNIIKSYLGICDRDIRHFNKRTGRDILSGILHVTRGYTFAKDIFKNQFKLNDGYLLTYKNLIKDKPLCDLKSSFLMEANSLRADIKNFRQEVNAVYEKGELTRFLKPKTQLLIQDNLRYCLQKHAPEVLMESLRMKIYNINEMIEVTY